jgi:hypothetical protein
MERDVAIRIDGMTISVRAALDGLSHGRRLSRHADWRSQSASAHGIDEVGPSLRSPDTHRRCRGKIVVVAGEITDGRKVIKPHRQTSATLGDARKMICIA